MRESTAYKRYKLLQNYVYKTKKRIEKAATPEKKKKAQESLQQFLEEQQLLKMIHNLEE